MSDNPLLSKVKLPGRVFQLPSKGLFYEPGVLAETVNNGEIHVKPMSALVELKLRSADLLFSGKVLDEVCAECIPEIKKPMSLVAKDVDAIFVFLVAATAGSKKTIKSMHNCSKAQPHDYDVDLDPILTKPNNSSLDNRSLLYTAPLSNGQVVKLKPVTFSASIDMLTRRQEINRREINGDEILNKEVEALVVADLMSVIEAVEDTIDNKPVCVTDRKQIEEWARSLSSALHKEIVSAANKTAEWGFDFTVDLKCRDCEEVYKHDLELNPVNFFSG